ncbi:Hypothetical protein precursor [Flavobacterium indicum GPTSA100-9 = DSM 17447]|uniref:Uncharacterized protein n=1 Tax=Flavobacterium indicum (strain DSM 17447 / CIP 109464 / GPTSA100-9) TaxID=1094466 RepID=H8XR28_FLAIG|nr:hypothetical protein [Flavobacterium indicum]CCG54262.1 Hypothetical protein precursor [Flavobacterium indicum GPTSA100-9 = DSM 17447]
MKQINLLKLIFVLLIVNCTFAQFTAKGYKSDEFNQFIASKTYFVLSGDKTYDEEIMNAANRIWKITSFSSLKKEELDSKITDKSASFVLLTTIPGKNMGQNYHYLSLINGGKKSISKYGYGDLIAYCPLNFYINEYNLYDCSYRISNMLESMVISIETVQKNDLNGNTYTLVKKLQEIYNKNTNDIKNRTLLICEESIGNKLKKEEIAGIYPYKFEMCNLEKLKKVIKDKDPNYYYLQPGITMNKSIFVFDPTNGNVVYFEFAIMGLAFNKGDLKDLVKAISN